MDDAANSRTSLLLLAPALSFLTLCFVVPLLYTFALSFTEPSVGVGNFTHALEPIYVRTFVNSFKIALTVGVLCLLIAYPTALFIVSRSKRTSNLLLALVIVPFFTSLLVRNYAWIFLLGSRGVINTTLISLGIISEPLPLMFNRFGVLVGMTHVMVPYLILILINRLRSIDERIIRAGVSLGCGPFGNFRRVILPLSLSAAGGGFILVTVISLAFFVTPAMLGSPQDSMIANEIASEIGFLNWGFGAALGMILLAITLLAVVLMQKAFGGIALIAPSLAAKQPLRARRGPLARALARPARAMDDLLDPIWNVLVAVVGALSLVFLILPVAIVVPLSLSSADYFVFPPPAWSLKWYQSFFDNPQWLEATRNSIIIALMTVVITMVIAIPAALGIVRSRSRAVIFAYLMILSPIIVPTIITAISIFFGFTKIGLGRTMLGIAIGHAIGAIPLAVVVMVTAFGSFDWALERAAMSLGAPRWKAMARIVLPILSGSVATAALLAFLHSFDDLLISLFLGGVRLETLPRRMWESLQEINPTIAAVSTLLIVLLIVLLASIQVLQHRQERRLLTKG